MGRKQGVGLRLWEAFGDLRLGVGQPEHAEQWHAPFRQFYTEVNHWMRIGRIQEIDAAGFELDGGGTLRSNTAPFLGAQGKVLDVFEPRRPPP